MASPMVESTTNASLTRKETGNKNKAQNPSNAASMINAFLKGKRKNDAASVITLSDNGRKLNGSNRYKGQAKTATLNMAER
jgi:hypothetical protein